MKTRPDILLQRYLRKALRTLGPDAVAKAVVAEFRHMAYPKHLRRYL